MKGVEECSRIEFTEKEDSHIPAFNCFAYGADYADMFREFTNIGCLLPESGTDYEMASAITYWVHSQWRHSGRNETAVADPIEIIREARLGKRFRCVEYSIVLHAALNSCDIKSRVLYLRTHGVETRPFGAGHVVVECFLRSFGKWAIFDPQFNIHAEVDGVPLNAVELQPALHSCYENVNMFENKSRINARKKRKYASWLCPYLYYFHTDTEAVYPPKYPRIQILLMPVGAAIPAKFQGIPFKETLVTTSSYRSFYPFQSEFIWNTQPAPYRL